MMNEKSNFYYDAVKGIYLNDGIVKFNIVSIPMAQGDLEEKITLISSFSRFESMVNFLNGELKKMKSIENSSGNNNFSNEEMKSEPILKKGKILSSFEKK